MAQRNVYMDLIFYNTLLVFSILPSIYFSYGDLTGHYFQHLGVKMGTLV